MLGRNQPDGPKLLGGPELLNGLSGIAASYNALICDVWGVLHDGQTPFDGADTALCRFRAQGGKVLLLSNAPRPSHVVAARLAEIGIRADACDSILTSGDAARAMVEERGKQGQIGYHVGPPKDRDLVAGLDALLGSLAQADYILFSGMYHDATETPDDYADAMDTWLARSLPLVCANPDRQVQFGDKVIYCAGAVAEVYEARGGEVIWLGKPYLPIYQRACAMLETLCGGPVSALAIGDGPKTDIPGAQTAGLDALFITGGLASALGHASALELDTPETIQTALDKENTRAAFAMRHLVW